MDYYVTIGIEIHCELKTNTKMFSGAPVRFGKVANTCTSVVDLGHPGILPCVNKEAVRLAIKACTAMHCELDTLKLLLFRSSKRIPNHTTISSNRKEWICRN